MTTHYQPWKELRKNVLQFADDITQIIITKFNGRINNNKKIIHNQNVAEEIIKQNEYEKKWKITTNMQKFKIMAIGNRKMPNLIINNTTIEYKTKAKLLGMKSLIVTSSLPKSNPMS